MTVHGTHCCKIHGCKYEDEDCPVVLGTEKGIQCEECQGAIRVMEQFDKVQFEVSEIKDWMEDGSNPTRSMVEFLLAEVDRLTQQVDDPLFGLEALKRQLEQGNLNTRWLIGIIDQTHKLLCPGSIGTWQQRSEQVLNFARRYAGKQADEE